jgi:hypothetical protein
MLRAGGARRALARAGLSAAALSGALVACAPAPQDYATLAAARAAGVFSQGLLPDILPAEASLIRVQVDPDDGQAEGWFHFPSGAYAALEPRLAPYAAGPAADPAVTTYIAKKRTRGYEAFEFAQPGARWLLLCSGPGGKCYFKRWPASAG